MDTIIKIMARQMAKGIIISVQKGCKPVRTFNDWAEAIPNPNKTINGIINKTSIQETAV